MSSARRAAIAVLALLAALSPAAPAPARAQDAYPSRPITVVAPFPPGGVADLTARPVAAALEKVLKQGVGVVNKTGAAGAVGMAHCPPILRAAKQLGASIERSGLLPAALLPLIYLRVALINGCPF